MKTFSKLSLSVLSLSMMSTAIGSIVSSYIPYSTYLDFAQNRGIFKPGATDLPIYDYNGKLVSTLTLPMMDFAVIGSDGFATLTAPNQVTSVAHNRGYTKYAFGSDYSYVIVERNNSIYNKTDGSKKERDFATSRTNKLVTEVAPVSYVEGTRDAQKRGGSVQDFVSSEKYADEFYRAGSGTQTVADPNRARDKYSAKSIAGAYQFLTGGVLNRKNAYVSNRYIPSDDHNAVSTAVHTQEYATPGVNLNYPMPFAPDAGDSGSGLFIYNKELEKWQLIALARAISKSYVIHYRTDYYTIVPGDNERSIEQHRKYVNLGKNNKLKLSNEPNGQYCFTSTSNSCLITVQGNNASETRKVAHTDVPHSNAGEDLFFTQNNAQTANASFLTKENEKTLITQQKSSKPSYVSNISLVNNINQGSGYMHFAPGNYDVKSADRENRFYSGGGIDIDEGADVKWSLLINQSDGLHRIGKGTLTIQDSPTATTSGGYLRFGDGVTKIATSRQAASAIYLTSGRPTVIQETDGSVVGNDLIWGLRGGVFEANGYSHSFNSMKQAQDYGAIYRNSNTSQKSTLTFHTPTTTHSIFHGQIEGNVNVTIKNDDSVQKSVAIDGSINTTGTLDIQDGDLSLQGHPVAHGIVNSQRASGYIKSVYGDEVNGLKQGATVPTRAEQKDWENRSFTFDNIKIFFGTLKITRNAKVTANKTKIDFASGLLLGHEKAFVDSTDTFSQVRGRVTEGSTVAPSDNERAFLETNIEMSMGNFVATNAVFRGTINAQTNSQISLINSDVSGLTKVTVDDSVPLVVNGSDLNLQESHTLKKVSLENSNSTFNNGDYSLGIYTLNNVSLNFHDVNNADVYQSINNDSGQRVEFENNTFNFTEGNNVTLTNSNVTIEAQNFASDVFVDNTSKLNLKVSESFTGNIRNDSSNTNVVAPTIRSVVSGSSGEVFLTAEANLTATIKGNGKNVTITSENTTITSKVSESDDSSLNLDILPEVSSYNAQQNSYLYSDNPGAQSLSGLTRLTVDTKNLESDLELENRITTLKTSKNDSNIKSKNVVLSISEKEELIRNDNGLSSVESADSLLGRNSNRPVSTPVDPNKVFRTVLNSQDSEVIITAKQQEDDLTLNKTKLTLNGSVKSLSLKAYNSEIRMNAQTFKASTPVLASLSYSTDDRSSERADSGSSESRDNIDLLASKFTAKEVLYSNSMRAKNSTVILEKEATIDRINAEKTQFDLTKPLNSENLNLQNSLIKVKTNTAATLKTASAELNNNIFEYALNNDSTYFLEASRSLSGRNNSLQLNVSQEELNQEAYDLVKYSGDATANFFNFTPDRDIFTEYHANIKVDERDDGFKYLQLAKVTEEEVVEEEPEEETPAPVVPEPEPAPVPEEPQTQPQPQPPQDEPEQNDAPQTQPSTPPAEETPVEETPTETEKTPIEAPLPPAIEEIRPVAKPTPPATKPAEEPTDSSTTPNKESPKAEKPKAEDKDSIADRNHEKFYHKKANLEGQTNALKAAYFPFLNALSYVSNINEILLPPAMQRKLSGKEGFAAVVGYSNGGAHSGAYDFSYDRNGAYFGAEYNFAQAKAKALVEVSSGSVSGKGFGVKNRNLALSLSYAANVNNYFSYALAGTIISSTDTVDMTWFSLSDSEKHSSTLSTFSGALAYSYPINAMSYVRASYQLAVVSAPSYQFKNDKASIQANSFSAINNRIGLGYYYQNANLMQFRAGGYFDYGSNPSSAGVTLTDKGGNYNFALASAAGLHLELGGSAYLTKALEASFDVGTNISKRSSVQAKLYLTYHF